MDDLPIDPDDETLAAFALIDAAGWVELSLAGEHHAALRAAMAGDPEVALAALMKVADRLALTAGEYANGPDETPRQAAQRLLEDLRRDFGTAR